MRPWEFESWDKEFDSVGRFNIAVTVEKSNDEDWKDAADATINADFGLGSTVSEDLKFTDISDDFDYPLLGVKQPQVNLYGA